MGSESDCGRAVIAGLKVVYDAENGIYELRIKPPRANTRTAAIATEF